MTSAPFGTRSAMLRKLSTLNTTMRSIHCGLRPIYTPLLHPKHTTRIPLASIVKPTPWTRSFHATASCRVVDLSYSLHDNQGKAKGDPIIILHGLFGSKKNNRSVSKYEVSPETHKLSILTNPSTAPSPAHSPVPFMPSTSATTATLRTMRRITIPPLPPMFPLSSKPTPSRIQH